MPSNIITVQVGQCGNQLGMAYWERMCLEHGIEPDGQLRREDQRGMDCKEIYFNENYGQKWVPRALLVDLEPRVLTDICNHENNTYSDLFDIDNIFQGPTGGGAGNNWARGYNPGECIVEDIMELLEAEAERADYLEGFAVCHSILGGTGSGLGSRLLREINDRFPKNLIQTYSTVQPMTCNVQVAPYNIVLSLDTILEHTDSCVLFDNDAFERQCKETNPLQKWRRDASSNENLANPTEKKNYEKINSMMSQVMTSHSAPVRFGSPNYTRLMHIAAVLNPFPPMIFLQPAITPLVPTRQQQEGMPKQQLVRFQQPKDVVSNLSDPHRLISSSQALIKLHQKQQQTGGETAAAAIDHNKHNNGCLLSGLIIVQSLAQNEQMSFGSVATSAGMGIADLYSHMRTRNQSRVDMHSHMPTRNQGRSKDNVYRSPPWMPSTMQLTSCRLSPYMNHDQHPVTGLLLANHTQVSVTLKSMANDFKKMWKCRANVHQYESAFKGGKDEWEQKMGASKESVDKLLALYREACTETFLPGSLETFLAKESKGE